MNIMIVTFGLLIVFDFFLTHFPRSPFECSKRTSFEHTPKHISLLADTKQLNAIKTKEGTNQPTDWNKRIKKLNWEREFCADWNDRIACRNVQHTAVHIRVILLYFLLSLLLLLFSSVSFHSLALLTIHWLVASLNTEHRTHKLSMFIHIISFYIIWLSIVTGRWIE